MWDNTDGAYSSPSHSHVRACTACQTASYVERRRILTLDAGAVSLSVAAVQVPSARRLVDGGATAAIDATVRRADNQLSRLRGPRLRPGSLLSLRCTTKPDMQLIRQCMLLEKIINS